VRHARKTPSLVLDAERLRGPLHRGRGMTGSLEELLHAGRVVPLAVSEAALFDGYVSALVSALQGSNLRYNSLAPQIASALPPSELVRIAESGDAGALAAIAGLDRDRAARIVGYLSDHGLEDVLGAVLSKGLERPKGFQPIAHCPACHGRCHLDRSECLRPVVLSLIGCRRR
jgi:hypothetical protein